MYKVKKVTPLENYILLLTFDTGEEKYFDVSPYLDKGIFVELKKTDYFKMVTIFFDSVTWPNGQDFDPDHLYIESHNKLLNHSVL